jgi:putative transposase
LPACGLQPARRYAYEDLPAWSPERAISEDTLRNPRVGKILEILREVEAQPRNWTKGANAWKKLVATRHGVALQSVYRWLQKYDKRGIAGLEHRKSNRGMSKVWTPEALDFWIGLCLKPEMRKMTLKALYDDCLIIEAQRRGWHIGCPESANWWYNKKATPELRALRDGGLRALDNLLPPVLRDYSDLAPFEMLVGDQHRYDFWVVDDDTGAVFRPECFLWQDLRTRIIYGAAFDHHYDAHLCGEALRIGMRIYGCFNAIYTDNGKPELSKYMMGILAEIRRLGMEWNLTLDTPMDVLDVDGEDVQPVVQPIAPGTHKRAIVKNAKAKLIEKTFDILEETLRSTFRLPGSVKRLTDDIHTQDVDHQEAQALAAQGKLLLASEFYLTVYKALDWYNREKAHRGVRREWAWSPKPVSPTPMDCLMACYNNDGWRPRAISDEAADLVFLKRIRRTVQLGRITIDGEIYEHDALLGLPKSQPVECRIRPFEADLALVYLDGQFLCPARPVEYSSMKDSGLATRKIVEKREKRKAIADRFRAMIKSIPDLREYSRIPEAEKVAAVVGEEKKRIEAARANMTRALAPEELAAEVAKLEALNERLPDGRTAAFAMSAMGKPIPPRPDFFTSNTDRYFWCIKCEAAGGDLSAEDRAFVADEEAAMTPDQRERWQFEREYGAN